MNEPLQAVEPIPKMYRTQRDRSTEVTSHAQGASIINVDSSKLGPLMWASTVMASVGCLAGVLALLIVVLYTAQLHRELQTEKRIQTEAIDEKRLENRMAMRVLGVDDNLDLQSHDISDVLKALQEKRK